MHVKLIASTGIDDYKWAGTGYVKDDCVTDADELAEFAGRNCYRSFHKPNEKTRLNEDYLAHILEVGHESVLEHASATFYIEASRSVLTELERHRHLSFSVLSQRYANPILLGIEIPPAITELAGGEYDAALDIILNADDYTTEAYEALYKLFSNKMGHKQAREAARAVLPNMVTSPMLVTGNHRAWRYVIKARHHVAADAEIRELARRLLKELRLIAPNTYRDIPDEPYGA